MPRTSVKTKRKLTGSHYTPRELASFLAEELCKYIEKDGPVEIMDPACGDGELLIAFRECAREQGLKTAFTAIDQDVDALAKLSARWANTYPIWFMQEDFLSMNYSTSDSSLFHQSDSLEKVDVIIANPPYVRTQHLGAERAQQLAMAFDLAGRVDLYHAFLVAMTKALKEGGLLGVITSNRFLSTRAGESIRAYLTKHYELLEVIDLGDTKLFEAAVLPAIIIGRKKSHAVVSEPAFTKIYETDGVGVEVDSIYEMLRREPGCYSCDGQSYRLTRGSIKLGTPSEPWQLTNSDEVELLLRISAKGNVCLGAIANIKVGVKTTADAVFIRRDWDQLEFDLRPEAELLVPILDSDDCKRWIEPTPTRRILYPYRSILGKRHAVDLDSYPRARSYFCKYEQRLKSRTYVVESNRKWFEIWVPHQPDAWAQQMIVGPDITPEPRFSIAKSGAVVNGNCYWITLKPGLDSNFIYVILALLNSKLFVKYYDLAFNNKLYSGRRRYLSQYLEKYPIFVGSPETYADITAIAKLLCETIDAEQRERLEARLETEILKYYELD